MSEKTEREMAEKLTANEQLLNRYIEELKILYEKQTTLPNYEVIKMKIVTVNLPVQYINTIASTSYCELQNGYTNRETASGNDLYIEIDVYLSGTLETEIKFSTANEQLLNRYIEELKILYEKQKNVMKKILELEPEDRKEKRFFRQLRRIIRKYWAL